MRNLNKISYSKTSYVDKEESHERIIPRNPTWKLLGIGLVCTLVWPIDVATIKRSIAKSYRIP